MTPTARDIFIVDQVKCLYDDLTTALVEEWAGVLREHRDNPNPAKAWSTLARTIADSNVNDANATAYLAASALMRLAGMLE